MTKDEFIKQYTVFAPHAVRMAIKARKEGLLALENCLNDEKVNNRDIFEYGLRFVIDGIDAEWINELLSNIIDQEKDEYTRLFKLIQKGAVLRIQEGSNARIMAHFLNSYTDLSLDKDPAIECPELK
jgi:flagellar motor component MotA